MSISVVIPAYNSMKYFKETLDSVMAQTLKPEEVLVIDDGSTDETVAFAESYGLPVRVFRRMRQRQAANRNFGVDQANGEWIAFLDHDDLWASNKLELQMAMLSRHPEADICYTGTVLLNQVGDTFQLGNVLNTPRSNTLDHFLHMHTCFPPGTVVIRKSAFVSIGGFDPNFRCAEDWQFWLRLFHAGYKFVDCPEPLFLCRHHDSNASLDALHVLDEDRLIYQRQIAPHIPWWTRWIHHARVWSGLESTAAYALRRTGNPRHLELMARSIARWPFDDPHRFKVLAHMLYMRLRSLLQRSSSAAFSTK